jgi:hypothetical protein
MKNIRQTFLLLTFLSALAAYSPAQDDPIRVETNLVTINVAVTDKSGNYIKGLKKEDFEVWDKGAKQAIDTFSAENVPLSFGIVYDLHPATDERTRMVLDALRQFTRELKPTDHYFVTVFNERGSLTTEFVPNAEQINANLTDVKPATPNSLYDAIFAASEKVRERRNTKQVRSSARRRSPRSANPAAVRLSNAPCRIDTCFSVFSKKCRARSKASTSSAFIPRTRTANGVNYGSVWPTRPGKNTGCRADAVI